MRIYIYIYWFMIYDLCCTSYGWCFSGQFWTILTSFIEAFLIAFHSLYSPTTFFFFFWQPFVFPNPTTLVSWKSCLHCCSSAIWCIWLPSLRLTPRPVCVSPRFCTCGWGVPGVSQCTNVPVCCACVRASVCVCSRAGEYMRARARVCVCVRVCWWVCVGVWVWEREREKERDLTMMFF